MNEFIRKIVSKIDKTNVDFIYLIGSYSRNNQNEFSDIDIIIALKDGNASYNENQYIDGTYVSLNYDSYNEIKKNYTDPLKYINGHTGIVNLIPLYDEHNKLNIFQNKCMNIDYFNDFKSKIDKYINKEVIDWIEEVNKACNGYFNNNPTKMLAGLHGLTYGMLNVLAVSEGIITSENGFLESFSNFFNNNEIYRLIEKAFGIEKISLVNRTISGLILYLDIIDIINYRFSEVTKNNVYLAKQNIIKVLNEVKK